MWELDCEESWALKNWCFWTVVLVKTLESPLDCKEIQPVNSKGDQSWMFIGRTDAGAETPILWPTDAKSWLIWKDLDGCWGRLKAGEEGDDRGWDGWVPSPSQWLSVWASSGSWWLTGKSGVLQSMGSQRVRHDWVNWTELNKSMFIYIHIYLKCYFTFSLAGNNNIFRSGVKKFYSILYNSLQKSHVGSRQYCIAKTIVEIHFWIFCEKLWNINMEATIWLLTLFLENTLCHSFHVSAVQFLLSLISPVSSQVGKQL